MLLLGSFTHSDSWPNSLLNLSLSFLPFISFSHIFIETSFALFRLRDYIFFRSLSAGDLAYVYHSSRSVVDINHPSQSGITTEVSKLSCLVKSSLLLMYPLKRTNLRQITGIHYK